MSDKIELGNASDFHVHLRDGAMMELVAPTVREGGVSLAYIMPNLVPPITTIERVNEYKAALQKAAPETTFWMTFYLSRDLTPELVEKAAKEKAIRGIKCYPAGVTTNSSAGVDPNDFSDFYPIFEVMEKYGLVLNLHGEKPSTKIANDTDNHDDSEDIHVLNAEPKFLPALFKLHQDFPKLKIVLEHCTTKAAIEAIDEINASRNPQDPITVAASITAHHLYLTIDSWAGNPINFCKPVAKLPSDKRALVDAAVSGKPYFFFGSDSAPHPLSGKARHVGVCAGVYTQSHSLSYLAEVFDQKNALDKLKGFVSDFGNAFYGVKKEDLKSQQQVVLVKKETTVPELIGEGELVVAPFMPGEKLSWGFEWV
ncbi:unnamed protein product [Kuraishia capsulata CBS 1993]|uniref:dihydroorotase n=1 Tax=Kuraishia capsulata CBS 1993 TaxID=1382522 RepID=W6MQP6_9ASCO|nr:uncharacterized protein KUCA_T00000175001 [Kuraishia capsulata CBS 1993]CDK24215.1 unnamed protein product [Kuraishia capsulata CBS 1993]